jgi:hypothetical protein
LTWKGDSRQTELLFKDKDPRAPRAPREALPLGLALVAIAYPILGGAITILGWAVHAPRLSDWGGNGINMKANAALCAMASGLALALMAFRPRAVRLARILAILVLTLAALTLVEHASNLDMGIDTLLFSEAPGALATAAPGRMGLPASLSFAILGAVLLLSSKPGGARRWATALALIPVSIVMLSLVGYLYGASQLYSVGRFTGIALQTSSMIAALAAGAIAFVPEHGAAAALRRDDPGGVALRRLLVGVLLFPMSHGTKSSCLRERQCADGRAGPRKRIYRASANC